jgi:WD40 repeat protein
MQMFWRVLYWLQILVIALSFFEVAAAVEAPPAAHIVGLSRPVPQGFDLHPSKSILATLRDSGAMLSDLNTLSVKRTLGIDEPLSSAIKFSANGAFVAIGHEEGVVSIWRLDGSRVTVLKGHLDRVMALAFSPDGKWLASGGDDGTLQVWSTKTWNLVVTLDGVTSSIPHDGQYNYQSVLGLGFSSNSRTMFSLETVYDGAARRKPVKRILSKWEVGSWLETGRLVRHLKSMDLNGYANPLDAPIALSNWGTSQLIMAADDGYGYPETVIPPTLVKLRRAPVNECFTSIGDPNEIGPSDTWPTALSVDSAKGWLAVAYLEGRRSDFHPGIALIPLGDGAAQRNWLTNKQSIQIAFDGRGHLYSLSNDGQVSVWDLEALPALSPATQTRGTLKVAACRPENETRTAQKIAPVPRKALVQLASWFMDPNLKNNMVSWGDYQARIDLIGDKLVLNGPHGRVSLNATTGALVEKEPEFDSKEFLIPNHSSPDLIVAESNSLVRIDSQSNDRKTIEKIAGWELIGASVAGDSIATAWQSKSGTTPRAVEFHILSTKNGTTRVVPPLIPSQRANLFVPPMLYSPLSFSVSEDGQWIAYELVGDSRLRTWELINARTGNSQRIQKPLQAFENEKLLEPDARWMGLAVFDAHIGKVEVRMRRHVSRIPADDRKMPYMQMFLAGAMPTDAKYVASGAFDGSIKLWNVAARAEIASVPGLVDASNLTALGFDRQDDTRFFSFHWNGTVTLWQIQEVGN